MNGIKISNTHFKLRQQNMGALHVKLGIAPTLGFDILSTLCSTFLCSIFLLCVLLFCVPFFYFVFYFFVFHFFTLCSTFLCSIFLLCVLLFCVPFYYFVFYFLCSIFLLCVLLFCVSTFLSTLNWAYKLGIAPTFGFDILPTLCSHLKKSKTGRNVILWNKNGQVFS